MLAGNDIWVGWLVPFPFFFFFFLSVSAFFLRSAPVQHLAGWQEEEQQGETDTVLVSFTLLLLLILRERILLLSVGKHPSPSESLICDDRIIPLQLTHYCVCSTYSSLQRLFVLELGVLLIRMTCPGWHTFWSTVRSL